jgi:hypothetical protein
LHPNQTQTLLHQLIYKLELHFTRASGLGLAQIICARISSRRKRLASLGCNITPALLIFAPLRSSFHAHNGQISLCMSIRACFETRVQNNFDEVEALLAVYHVPIYTRAARPLHLPVARTAPLSAALKLTDDRTGRLSIVLSCKGPAPHPRGFYIEP